MGNYTITFWFKNGFTITYHAMSYYYQYKDGIKNAMYLENANESSVMVFFGEVVAWEIKNNKGGDSLIN